MPDAETYSEFIARYKVVEALRAIWWAGSPMRDPWFPPDTEPRLTWEPIAFGTEDEAIAAGMAALWP